MHIKIEGSLIAPTLSSVRNLESTISKIHGHWTYAGHKSVKMILSDEEAAQLKIWVVKKLEDMYVYSQSTTSLDCFVSALLQGCNTDKSHTTAARMQTPTF